MTFGIQGSNNYSDTLYNWTSSRNNQTNSSDQTSTTQAANTDANPLEAATADDQSTNTLWGADKDVRNKDDKDLTPEEEKAKLSGHKSTPEECETCKRRKYQDGSNEMVSFKAAGHIDPGNAASVVMSHEQEHVANAFQKAKDGNGEVVRASVRLKTAVCPECGRTYISGGETDTQIRYYNEDNPYQQDMKESDADNKYRGANVDIPA